MAEPQNLWHGVMFGVAAAFMSVFVKLIRHELPTGQPFT
jgi:hypothetical protein